MSNPNSDEAKANHILYMLFGPAPPADGYVYMSSQEMTLRKQPDLHVIEGGKV